MHQTLTRFDLIKLRHKLRRLRVASWQAIERGDCKTVAKLTCEAARLQEAISVVEYRIVT